MIAAKFVADNYIQLAKHRTKFGTNLSMGVLGKWVK